MNIQRILEKEQCWRLIVPDYKLLLKTRMYLHKKNYIDYYNRIDNPEIPRQKNGEKIALQ